MRELLALADIGIGGDRPWDIRVHDRRFYRRVLAGGTLGFGESYMDGWWDCDALDAMVCRAARARLEDRLPLNLHVAGALAASFVFNLQSRRGARVVGRRHYDIGNDFFAAMLDSAMQYSCAYWQHADDLESAQHDKMDRICRKLGLESGMSLLDIGCGWGGLARHAAVHYGCRVTGITISKAQQEYAAGFCRGLPVEVRIEDYRDVVGSFDRAVSVGMVEHVGAKNYRRYIESVARVLPEGGVFLCHTIASNISSRRADPWVTRYIFPNSVLPSAAQLARAAEGHFVIEDVENFGADYDRTLLAWEANFSRAWPAFRERYGERFRRMWRFYLLGCAGAFRARSLQLLQFVFSKGGIPGGWRANL